MVTGCPLNFFQCSSHEPHEQVVSDIPFMLLSFMVDFGLLVY
jgi:hypothetical protein